eukprot:m.176209 g.176209  ORF g.176209 m.176209 type:complete len:307 (+) comp17937_c0_seq3:1560-2480(+)
MNGQGLLLLETLKHVALWHDNLAHPRGQVRGDIVLLLCFKVLNFGVVETFKAAGADGNVWLPSLDLVVRRHLVACFCVEDPTNGTILWLEGARDLIQKHAKRSVLPTVIQHRPASMIGITVDVHGNVLVGTFLKQCRKTAARIGATRSRGRASSWRRSLSPWCQPLDSWCGHGCGSRRRLGYRLGCRLNRLRLRLECRLRLRLRSRLGFDRVRLIYGLWLGLGLRLRGLGGGGGRELNRFGLGGWIGRGLGGLGLGCWFGCWILFSSCLLFCFWFRLILNHCLAGRLLSRNLCLWLWLLRLRVVQY